jgi:hypothetical protein
MIDEYELERVWKDTVPNWGTVPEFPLGGGGLKKTEKRQNSQCPSWDLNQAHPGVRLFIRNHLPDLFGVFWIWYQSV